MKTVNGHGLFIFTPMPIRILAIDDDPIFAESIREMVEEIGHLLIEVVSEITEFKRLVKATDPELLLIDIDLGQEISGIELANELSTDISCPFIFITSHTDLETTQKAIELLPAAYITKPINSAALLSAISLAESKHVSKSRPGNATGLFIKAGGALKKFKAEDIYYVEVMDKSCFLHTSQGEIEVTIRLKDLKKQLPKGFIQIHRSYIVNLEAIQELDSQVATVTVNTIVESMRQLPVGRSYRDELLRNMNRIG